MVRKIIHDLT
ncbi:hypothetical protein VCHENC02_2015A, partial [Vibrio harveyi]